MVPAAPLKENHLPSQFDRLCRKCYKTYHCLSSGGAVAQLGARLDGIEEVEGSNPFGSTKYFLCLFTCGKTAR